MTDARTGYDDRFLGPDAAVAVPAPLAHEGAPVAVLPYVHFSVGLHTGRRLAAWTAVNVDGGALVDVGRGDDWHLDDRVAEGEQAGPELYVRNDIDRGHLVRRRDPVWGDRDVAERANRDTFAYTNAAPQAAGFNQSKELWLGLEDHVLGAAEAADARVSVFTGCVFASDDAEYRGVLLPQRFYKVGAWVADGALAAAAWVLDQTPQLDDVDLSLRGEPLLGPFRTFQVPVADVAALTALEFGPLADADVAPVAGILPGAPWRPIASAADLVLRRA